MEGCQSNPVGVPRIPNIAVGIAGWLGVADGDISQNKGVGVFRYSEAS